MFGQTIIARQPARVAVEELGPQRAPLDAADALVGVAPVLGQALEDVPGAERLDPP
jgi:hypothetical protein